MIDPEKALADERYVVGELQKRLNTVRDELLAAKTLWLEVHTRMYRIEGEETVHIPVHIYERLNELLGKGVEIK